MHLLLSQCALTFLLLAAAARAEWQELPALPEPNGGFLCGIDDGHIIVLGGTHWEGGSKNWLKALHEYDPTTRQWKTKADALKTPIAYGVEMQNGPRFGFLGGSDGTGPLKVLGTFEDGQVRLQTLPELPATLVLSAGGRLGERMVIAGGTADAANIAGVTCGTYLIENGRVRRQADFPGRPFAVAASTVVQDELFVFGGMDHDQATDSAVNSATAYVFAPATNQWRALKSLPQATRGLAAVVLDDSHIYLGGGFAQEFTPNAFVYDVKADAYKPAVPLPYAAMVRLVRLGDFVYCLGGEDKMKSRTAKFYRIPVQELLK